MGFNVLLTAQGHLRTVTRLQKHRERETHRERGSRERGEWKQRHRERGSREKETDRQADREKQQPQKKNNNHQNTNSNNINKNDNRSISFHGKRRGGGRTSGPTN